MYYQTGKDQQAIDAFSQAIRLKPGLFVPNLFLGTRLCEVEAVQRGDSLSQTSCCFLIRQIFKRGLALGQAYAGVGKTRLAIASYLRAVQLDPRNADAWFHLGVSYLEHGRSRRPDSSGAA